jgi:hypothetical protein
MRRLIFLAVAAIGIATVSRAQVTSVPAATGGSNGNATQLQGRNLAATAPADTNVMCWSAGSSQWQPCSSGAANNPYIATLSFTGAAVTITATTHGKGSNPTVELYDSWGKTLATYYCTTSGGAIVGCADASSTGNIVILPFKPTASASGGTAPYAFTVAIRN